MLDHWYQQICKNYVKQIPILHKDLLSPDKKQELLTTFKSSEYSSSIVIEELDKVKEITSLQYKNKVHLNILEIPDQPIDLRIYRKVVQRIATLLEMYDGPFLEFWILPCKHLRTLPSKDEPITPSNVNGGFTFHQLGKIYIFRESEFPKVALHETLHNLKLFDIRHWKNADLKKLYDTFHLNQDGCQSYCMTCCYTQLEPNEAIIELWAVLFQVMFVAYEMHFDYNTMMDMILIEQRWAQYTSQLLVERGALKQKEPWIEETHTFSYILLKSALLQDLKGFLSISMPYQSTHLTHYLIEAVRKGTFAKKHPIFENIPFRFAWFSDL